MDTGHFLLFLITRVYKLAVSQRTYWSFHLEDLYPVSVSLTHYHPIYVTWKISIPLTLVLAGLNQPAPKREHSLYLLCLMALGLTSIQSSVHPQPLLWPTSTAPGHHQQTCPHSLRSMDIFWAWEEAVYPKTALLQLPRKAFSWLMATSPSQAMLRMKLLRASRFRSWSKSACRWLPQVTWWFSKVCHLQTIRWQASWKMSRRMTS